MVRAPGEIDRIEACFSGVAFAPHRHDTYAIGITLAGVQCFDYRGATRHSCAGQMVVLHPDERHDGRAGDERAFRYRTAYIAPAEIENVLDGGALPFVEGGICDNARLYGAALAMLQNYDQPLTALQYQDILYEVAMALCEAAGRARAGAIVNREAAIRAREYIDANLDQSFSLDDLERVAGHNRWQLSRDFRAVCGTSPHRYLLFRRLDLARAMMIEGRQIGHAALDCGFADQSHFNRTFKKAFGVTPASWLSVAGSAHNRSIPV